MLESPPDRHQTSRMADPERSRFDGLPPLSYYAAITVTVVVVLALLRAAFEVRHVLILVAVAAVLAIGLDPAVRRLEALRMRRGLAVAIIFVAATLFLVLFAALVVPPLANEVRQLSENIPDYVTRLRSSGGWLGDLARRFNISTRLADLTSRLPSVASSSLSTIFGFTKGLASVIFSTLTVAILTVYFLFALPRMKRTSVALFRPHRREQAGVLQGQALDRIGGFVSGNIFTSLIAGMVSFVVLTLIGVPFAAALAMWVAITDLIPAVGATLGAVVAVIVALFSSTADGVVTALFFIAYQQFENYYVAPRVMRHAVDVSPVAVIVATLIGGSLAGFAGVLLALPVAAAVKVVLRETWLNQRLAADE